MCTLRNSSVTEQKEKRISVSKGKICLQGLEKFRNTFVSSKTTCHFTLDHSLTFLTKNFLENARELAPLPPPPPLTHHYKKPSYGHDVASRATI